MSNLPSAIAESGSRDWVSGKIAGLIVRSEPDVHYRILFHNAENGRYSWPAIDAALYDLASAAYLNDKSVAVQGNTSSTGKVVSILAS